MAAHLGRDYPGPCHEAVPIGACVHAAQAPSSPRRTNATTARDLYTQIAASVDLSPAKINSAFKSLADDEQRRADLAQGITDIIADAL